MNKNFFLKGERIYFRQYKEEDLESLCKWFNDPEVTHYMFTGQQPITLEQVKSIVSAYIEDEHTVFFVMCDIKTDKTIGIMGIYEMHFATRKGEMRILIGNKEFWGKGYGTEATEMINFYAFDRLNLNRIYLGVTDENKGGVNAYKKAGYEHEGTLRQDLYRNSKYYDSIRMGLLREDYYKKYHSDHKKRFSIKK